MTIKNEGIFSKSDVIWLVKCLVRRVVYPKGEKEIKMYVHTYVGGNMQSATREVWNGQQTRRTASVKIELGPKKLQDVLMHDNSVLRVLNDKLLLNTD